MFSCVDNAGWVKLVRRLHSTHYTQSFLKPGQSYLFVVRAENSHGLSAPSHLSNRVSLPTEYRQSVSFSHDMSIAKSTLFGGHIVDLIDIKTVSSTSIKLFWEVSSLQPIHRIWPIIIRYTIMISSSFQILNGEFLEGFYLYYRSKNMTGQNATFMKTLSNATELSGAYVINSLQPSVTYLFFLVPYYRHIKGRPSNSRTAKTHEDCKENTIILLDLGYFLLPANTRQL